MKEYPEEPEETRLRGLLNVYHIPGSNHFSILTQIEKSVNNQHRERSCKNLQTCMNCMFPSFLTFKEKQSQNNDRHNNNVVISEQNGKSKEKSKHDIPEANKTDLQFVL